MNDRDRKMKNKGKGIQLGIVIVSLFVIFLSVTYAFVSMRVVGEKRQVITSGTLSLELFEDENNLAIEDALPMYDEVGMIQDAFTFRLTNDSQVEANYVLKLEEIIVDGGLLREDVKYGLTRGEEVTIDFVSNIIDNVIDEGTIPGNETVEYELRLWIRDDIEDITRIENKAIRFRMNIEARQIKDQVYSESILNGCDPVLSNNLVPVIIEDDGTVKKANVYTEWYDYENKRWANAVVLEDNTIEYTENQVIPDGNIESYFVWIPKYRYQLWDLGNYNGLTSLNNTKVHTIGIQFGLYDTNDSVEGECTSPKTSGGSGNCKVGDYMTHPAFQAFDSNGFWVGKFESGYKGATSTETAQVNSSDSTKLQIKPNVYSWRNITIGNAFKVSYDYLRNEESHMMKNTEWGAVAYLQHSEYGSRASVRVNNNNSYMTGYAAVKEPTCGSNTGISIDCNLLGTSSSITLPYNTEIGYTASTTGNITGIYDMSGGASEYVMAYNMSFGNSGSESGLNLNFKDFFLDNRWEKYYDKYLNTATTNGDTMYSVRILGDAIGEIGPFGLKKDPDGVNRFKSSWYTGHSHLINLTTSWLNRSNAFMGSSSGIFSFGSWTGVNLPAASFRLVLAPKK